MSRAEHDLGPLWDSAPKSRGFRVSIPEPAELSYWVRQFSSERGDLTQEEMLKNADAQIGKFLTRQSQRFWPTERIWEATIGDSVLESIHVKLMAGYSPKSGEWGTIIFYVEPSSQAVAEGRQWEIPAQSARIAESLQKQGFDASVEKDSDGERRVIVHDRNGEAEVIINLGFTSPEEAAKADPDYDPNYTDSIIITLNDLPVSVPDSMKHLQHLQVVTSYAIDAIYQALNVEPPNITLELSGQSELR